MSKTLPIHQTADFRHVDDAASFRDPKPAQAPDGDDLARLETLCDMIKADAECLTANLPTIKHTLDAAQEDIRKERERVLNLVAEQQRLQLASETFLIHQAADFRHVDDAASFRDPKPAQAPDGDDLARLETLCDMIKADAECLTANLPTIKHTLDAAQEDIRKERERVLNLVAEQQRLQLASETFLIHQAADFRHVDDAASFRDPKPAQAPDGDDLARLETLCDMIKADAECLTANLPTIKHTLDAAQEDVRKERERVLNLVAEQQRLLESDVCKSRLVFDRGEMAIAQAVLAAQQRTRSQAGESPLLKRLQALRAVGSQARRAHGTSDGSAILKIEDIDVETEPICQIRRPE